MDYTILGRTGLRVSRMGLGCGGHSRLGLSAGQSEADAIGVVHEAISLGINFVDTAEAYGTEDVVGRAVTEVRRDDIILSTKASINWEDRRSTASTMRLRVDKCLDRLRTDYIDVFHLHGVQCPDYSYACEELLPLLQDLKSEGKIRFIGVTEAFGPDPSHKMLAPAIQDDFWDVVMVGHNILNQSARGRVHVKTQEKHVGTLCMFAVRRALSRPDVLKQLIGEMIANGLINGDHFKLDDPLGFLVEEGHASSIQEASYRFCRHEPGIDLVLSGTGSVEHLRENAATLNMPPLPLEVVERLKIMFDGVDSVSGN